MAKAKKSVYFCQNCGHEESKWLGQCPACKEWNTFVEEKVSPASAKAVKEQKDAQVVTLSGIEADEDDRMDTGIEELNRVLGGGIVKGSLVLVGGDPASQPFYCKSASVFRRQGGNCSTYPEKNP